MYVLLTSVQGASKLTFFGNRETGKISVLTLKVPKYEGSHAIVGVGERGFEVFEF